MFTGVELKLVKVVERGKKLGYQLILSRQVQSGGMGTVAINTWLSTNFEETLVLDTCYVGSIGTQLLWKQKEVRLYSKLYKSGLRAIFRPNNGFLL